MDVILWTVIVLLFILGFVGLIFPILPSILLIWAGFLLYIWGIGGSLSTMFWIGMALFTVLIFAADAVANSYFVKRYGGSRAGGWAAIIGVIVGAFIIPPFGIFIVPFLAVFITEWIIKRDVPLAFQIGTASLFAFLSSSIAKLVIQLFMIGWFFLEVWL
ncbi:DUF456 domain-containing protein [Halalkalibacterium halodurans]|jgi:uncharacterized protein YqgC (DUF456 family)|uniref:BH3807 protein n=2 Tax=Halalkalibacterium halodurans TaxID=86665 RepID=Q9K6C2_HALH5|nr:DUF456 domain-containing protein [Halalkalibacterium halodurans]MDY7224311.1 DUF456 domain-containing protein [Halalkalibacterium halodurans]MDY7243596.1 DUF456 domain-containing protein [Halalkalibacterium halodurans]MED3646463.1 DUF456 domain-containing protein [Halalkalibacterium halodurans]MED4079516.1 DUF456 domain-containing protein [Halalkalibacterium halodurans]MED4084207.1 DUF456 domain-containing protein [Halalkalibacterium halodurans]